MKNIERLIWLFLIIIFTHSCSKENEELCQKNGIQFYVSDVSTFTRGTPINTSTEIPNMALYGYYTGRGITNNWANNGASATPNFVDAKVITNNSGVWSSSEPIYWPQATDANISFFTYSPTATTDNGIAVTNTTGVPTLTYTVPTDVTKQPDLMVAPPQFDLNINNGNNVSFAMKHALTSVGFRVAGAGEVVTGVKISGVKTTGTLSMDGTNVTWSNLGPLTTTEFNAGVNTVTSSATMTSLMQGNGYLMMIPQTLDTNAKIIITLNDNSTKEISLSGTQDWIAGKTVYYNITFTSSGIVTVTPSSLLLPWTVVDHTSGNITVTCEDGNGNDSPSTAWTLTTNDPWLKLSLNPNDAAGASQTLSGTGSRTVYTYATANAATTNRTTTITYAGNTVVNVTQLGTSPLPDGDPGTLMDTSYPYIGAFWKSSERGERVIRIPAVWDGDEGAWVATVYWKDANWASNDIVFDNNLAVGNTLYTASPGNAESYLITSGQTFASGFANIGDPITFRIGLASTLASPTTAPRYATVVLSYANGTKSQLLFLRQGEAPDYLMRPTDPVNSGDMNSATRPAAVKFAAYNLTDPNGTFNRDIGIRGGGFTNYPTKSGGIFQFANTNNRTRYAWAPSGTISGWTTSNLPLNTYWDTFSATHETCPAGYRRPNDGTTTGYNTTASVIGSEMRQSLFLNPQTSTTGNADNSIFGYYADGYFDRYLITSNCVNSSTNNIACAGRLFFNPTTKASLFFPAAGSRFWSTGAGPYPGNTGIYWTSSMSQSAYGYYLQSSRTNAVMVAHNISYSWSIRPVVE